ncbi:MAG TPA: Holliday junction resolvase RuvX [Crenotrichaceae bacterium]|nr:Holliday junction resolvase RuvX [Crenotrichaceae bacterium]
MLETSHSTITKGTCLGFDFGLKKIGVATGDAETGIANALTTIVSVPKQIRWNAIEQLIIDWKPDLFVVGLSHNMDGSDHDVTRAIQKFTRQLEGRFGLPVHQVDETLSSREAWELLYMDNGVSHSKALRLQDQVAAQLIVQSWLDQQTV